MPPKKKDKPSTKTVNKVKEKIVEDKTFGLKNKKGKKQQDFIKRVQQEVKHGSRDQMKAEAEKKRLLEEKKAKKQAAEDLAHLFKTVPVTQKVPFGVDPKTVVCDLFRKGQCKKGDKCKFSHDLSVERKVEKKNLYVDSRDTKKNDTMEDWSQEELENVVKSKHGAEKKKNETNIVCKHFLDAIEKNLYGWFWTCPNGGDTCMYRHALPPGFVLKRDAKRAKEEAEKNKLSIEELVESERAKLGSGQKLTKVTPETFAVWYAKKRQEKKDAAEAEVKRLMKEAAKNKGHRSTGMSGRQMLEFNPELFATADVGDEEVVDLVREKDEDEEEDDTPVFDVTSTFSAPIISTTTTSSATSAAPAAAVDANVDESLFAGDDLEALDLDDEEGA